MKQAFLSMTIVVAITAAIAAGCIGGSGGSTASREPVSSSDFFAAAEEAARNTVLLLEHAPDGWASAPDEPPEAPEPGVEVGPECQYINELDEGFPGQLVFVNGDALFPTDAPGPEINSEASVFEREDEAAAALERHAEFFRNCSDDYVAAIKAQAASEPGMAAVAEFTVTEIDGATIGDGVFGMRLNASLGGQSVVVDFVTVRQGRILATLAVGADQPFEDDRATYLEILAERADAADEALPPLAEE